MNDYNDKLHGNSRVTSYENARALRKIQTGAEKKMWQVLRNKKVCNLKFRRQHAFDDYILDFYCHEIKLVIEVDGEVHNIPDVAAYDINRTKNLEASGLTVLRFTNNEVEKNIKGIITKIKEWYFKKVPGQNMIK